MKKIIITGSCGFIGFHLSKKLCEIGYHVIGIDNFSGRNKKLIKTRLKILKKLKNFNFEKKDLSKNFDLKNKGKFLALIHLAAKPGVRDSLLNPKIYFNNNLEAFFNIIEFSRRKKINNFLYASSSSVYGNLKNSKAYEDMKDLNPLSFYALTKYFNERMAKYYTQVYKLNTVGLRFFSIYGPYGRDDMAYYKFPLQIIKKEIVKLNNKGNDLRDFTHVDNAVNGIINILKKIVTTKNKSLIFNIGSDNPVKISKILRIIEKQLDIKPKVRMLKKNKLDPFKTHADLKKIKKIGYSKNIKFQKGYEDFLAWFRKFYKI